MSPGTPGVMVGRLRQLPDMGTQRGTTVHRRASTLSLTVLLLAALPAGAARAAADETRPTTSERVDAPQGRPNVVVILVDDLAEIGRSLWQRMPNIRETFLRHGVTFTDAHGESPLCCPGRAGFLTGLHTFHHGVTVNDVALLDDSMTLGTQFQEAGYFTFWAGKYFNKYHRIAPYLPPGWDRFHTMTGGYYNYRLWSNGGTAKHRKAAASDYVTDVTRARALSALRKAPRDQPLFGVASFFAPHGPTTPARRHLDDPRCDGLAPWAPANYNERNVSDKPAYVRARPRLDSDGYDLTDTCRTLLGVDEAVGAVRAELAAQDRLDDTLLVLMSDNGMNFGAHRLMSKSTPYATQIPLMVSWPSGLGLSPRTVSQRVMNIDLAPTFCELAGCVMGPYPGGPAKPDGQSIVPLLMGTGSLSRDAVITNMPDGNLDVPPWYAVSTTERSTLRNKGCAGSAQRLCRWHYVEYGTGEKELYDVHNGPCRLWTKGMAGDPCELENLAGDPAYSTIENRLRKRLAELKAGDG